MFYEFIYEFGCVKVPDADSRSSCRRCCHSVEPANTSESLLTARCLRPAGLRPAVGRAEGLRLRKERLRSRTVARVVEDPVLQDSNEKQVRVQTRPPFYIVNFGSFRLHRLGSGQGAPTLREFGDHKRNHLKHLRKVSVHLIEGTQVSL